MTRCRAHWDLDFGGGTFRFRGLSGPLGSAAAAVTNHAGATAVSGTHLAVHYDDNSGRPRRLGRGHRPERTPSTRTGRPTTRSGLDIADPTVFVDADVLLGDIRLAAAGRIDGFPNTVRVGLDRRGAVDSSDALIGIAADRPGRQGLGPVRAGRPAVRQRHRRPGPGLRGGGSGCSDDGTPFCSTFDRCFGVVGNINLPALPTSVSLRPGGPHGVDPGLRRAVDVPAVPGAGEHAPRCRARPW